MSKRFLFGIIISAGSFFAFLPGAVGQTSPPAATGISPESILRYVPIQPGVEIDTPDAAQCKVELVAGNKGYVLKGPDNAVLRVFVDVKGMKTVDQRSYYKGGFEVYREIDTDANKVMDQFRWFHQGGSRWGIDEDEDGVIDRWQQISPEEVASEIVAALASGDEKRFLRVVPSKEELAALGFAQNSTVAEQIAELSKNFRASANALKLQQGARWFMSQNSKAGIVPNGAAGNAKDIEVYENVIASLSEGENSRQISIGTLVRIGENNWRAVSLPKAYDEAEIRFTFFPPAGDAGQGAPAGIDPRMEKFIADAKKIQDELFLPNTADARRRLLIPALADIFDNIIRLEKDPKNKGIWIQQAADNILDGMSLQGKMLFEKDGFQRLETFRAAARSLNDVELAAYLRYRIIMTELFTASRAENIDDETAPDIHSKWLKDMEEFVKDDEKTLAGAEGAIQLASTYEVFRRKQDALDLYTGIERNFPQSVFGKKANGAIRRIESPGKLVPFTGADGTPGAKSDAKVNLADYKNSITVLYFWGSWIDPADFNLAAVDAAFGKSGVKFIGVNLDVNKVDMDGFLRRYKLPGQQIYEPGSFDGPPAIYWGVTMSPPMFIILGKDGRVLEQGILSVNALSKKLEELTTEK